jgi:hypothetical protein
VRSPTAATPEMKHRLVILISMLPFLGRPPATSPTRNHAVPVCRNVQPATEWPAAPPSVAKNFRRSMWLAM